MFVEPDDADDLSMESGDDLSVELGDDNGLSVELGDDDDLSIAKKSRRLLGGLIFEYGFADAM
jgi:hypothetical protein